MAGALIVTAEFAPSAEAEILQILRTLAQSTAPRAWIAGVMDLGGGVALRVTSAELDAIRREIAERLHGLLAAQDTAGWSAHITVQNKVAPREARALIKALGDVGRPLGISALGLHRYLDGPWEAIRAFRFRG